MSRTFRRAVLLFRIARIRRAIRQVEAFNARLAKDQEEIDRHYAWEAISGDSI